MTTIPARMHQRRRTFAQWESENPTLAVGEIGLATATGLDQLPTKVGDGTHAWNSLPWFSAVPAFSIPATAMDENGLTVVRTNRVYRIQLPATGTSSIYMGGIGFPVWWFQTGVQMGFDWVNDHGATGNVRMRWILQQNDNGGAIASASTPVNVTETLSSPDAGDLNTNFVNGLSTFTLTPGTFGSLYTMEITRLGDDAADTLAGPISLAEFVYLAAP